MITKEEKQRLDKIKKQTNEPQNEEKFASIVKNNHQYKIILPKKFLDYINYKDDKKARVTLVKKENKIIIEIK